MSDIVTVQGRTAATIAAEIRAHNSQFIFCVFEIGRLLIEAKELVPTGEWMDYLQTELGYKQSTANNFMRIYKGYNVDGKLPESQTFGNLSPSKALELLALEPAEREEFMEQTDVESLSVRELRAAIRERDEARQEAEAAKAETETARAETRQTEQALLDAQTKVNTAKSNEDAWRAEIDKLNAALNKATASEQKAKQELKNLKKNPKVPAAMKDQLLAEAKAEAASCVSAELKAQLDAAVKQAQDAVREKDAALQSVREAEEKLASMQKNALLADPNVAALNLLFDDIQTSFNKANGHLKKMTAADPEKAARFKEGFRKLIDAMREQVG